MLKLPLTFSLCPSGLNVPPVRYTAPSIVRSSLNVYPSTKFAVLLHAPSANFVVEHIYRLEPVHIKIASKIIAKVRFPKYRTSSLS